MVGPDLADNQYGFRQGRSTADAIMRVKALAEEAEGRSGVGGVLGHRQRVQHYALELHQGGARVSRSASLPPPHSRGIFVGESRRLPQ
ncbi:unnamed protein product [Arctia plantaginis]|uniref:Uncharacterized protein n=1 Tax=Arctia plantaginis TaxID=874455 RepID=A0A8S1AWZ9_ARCPL|nr:unnamed protein product [Arctia plantaginis]